MGRSLAFPFGIGSLGLPRAVRVDRVYREQLEQLLFTLPGERVNRPDFGCGVQRLVFGPASPQAASVAQYVISNAISKFIPEIRLDAVSVLAEDATLSIDILYTVQATGEELAEHFETPMEVAP